MLSKRDEIKEALELLLETKAEIENIANALSQVGIQLSATRLLFTTDKLYQIQRTLERLENAQLR